MSVLHLLQSILELGIIIFIVWGFFHEDKFISFERRLMSYLRRRRLKVAHIKCRVQNAKCKIN